MVAILVIGGAYAQTDSPTATTATDATSSPTATSSSTTDLIQSLWAGADSLLSEYYPSTTITNVASLTWPSTVVIGSSTIAVHPSSTPTTNPTPTSSNPTNAAAPSSPAPTAGAASANANTTTGSDSSSDTADKRLGIGLGVGLGLLALAILVGALWLLHRRRRRTGSFMRRPAPPPDDEEILSWRSPVLGSHSHSQIPMAMAQHDPRWRGDGDDVGYHAAVVGGPAARGGGGVGQHQPPMALHPAYMRRAAGGEGEGGSEEFYSSSGEGNPFFTPAESRAELAATHSRTASREGIPLVTAPGVGMGGSGRHMHTTGGSDDPYAVAADGDRVGRERDIQRRPPTPLLHQLMSPVSPLSPTYGGGAGAGSNPFADHASPTTPRHQQQYPYQRTTPPRNAYDNPFASADDYQNPSPSQSQSIYDQGVSEGSYEGPYGHLPDPPIIPAKSPDRNSSPNVHYPSGAEISEFDFGIHHHHDHNSRSPNGSGSGNSSEEDGGDGWRRPGAAPSNHQGQRRVMEGGEEGEGPGLWGGRERYRRESFGGDSWHSGGSAGAARPVSWVRGDEWSQDQITRGRHELE